MCIFRCKIFYPNVFISTSKLLTFCTCQPIPHDGPPAISVQPPSAPHVPALV